MLKKMHFEGVFFFLPLIVAFVSCGPVVINVSDIQNATSQSPIIVETTSSSPLIAETSTKLIGIKTQKDVAPVKEIETIETTTTAQTTTALPETATEMVTTTEVPAETTRFPVLPAVPLPIGSIIATPPQVIRTPQVDQVIPGVIAQVLPKPDPLLSILRSKTFRDILAPPMLSQNTASQQLIPPLVGDGMRADIHRLNNQPGAPVQSPFMQQLQ